MVSELPQTAPLFCTLHFFIPKGSAIGEVASGGRKIKDMFETRDSKCQVLSTESNQILLLDIPLKDGLGREISELFVPDAKIASYFPSGRFFK